MRTILKPWLINHYYSFVKNLCATNTEWCILRTCWHQENVFFVCISASPKPQILALSRPHSKLSQRALPAVWRRWTQTLPSDSLFLSHQCNNPFPAWGQDPLCLCNITWCPRWPYLKLGARIHFPAPALHPSPCSGLGLATGQLSHCLDKGSFTGM